MDFPANSKRPPVAADRNEPKRIQRVATGDVVRRKKPLGRRLTENVIGGNAQSVWGYVIGEVLVPAARDMIVDAITGGAERAIFGESRGPSRRGGYRPVGTGHTPYNRYGANKGSSLHSSESRREMSLRSRANHNFEEIILQTRVEAEETLDRMIDLVERYEHASVADLYELVGVTASYTDQKYGWLDLRNASISRVRDGYLLNLPRPEPID